MFSPYFVVPLRTHSPHFPSALLVLAQVNVNDVRAEEQRRKERERKRKRRAVLREAKRAEEERVKKQRLDDARELKVRSRIDYFCSRPLLLFPTFSHSLCFLHLSHSHSLFLSRRCGSWRRGTVQRSRRSCRRARSPHHSRHRRSAAK